MAIRNRSDATSWIDEEVATRRNAEYNSDSQAFAHVAMRALCDLDDDEAYEACEVGVEAEGIPDAYWLDENGPRALLAVVGYEKKGKAKGDRELIARLNSAVTKVLPQGEDEQPLMPALRQISDLRRRDTSVPLEAAVICFGLLDDDARAELKQVRKHLEDSEITITLIERDELLARVIETESRDAPEMSEPVELSLLDHFSYEGDPPAIVANLSALELAELEQKYGFQIFQSNVRYLLKGRQRINEGIEETIRDANDRDHFWYYNNGIAVMCDSFEPAEITSETETVTIHNFQIVNGCQTTATLARSIDILREADPPIPILARIIASKDAGLRDNIPLFNNRQNAVKNRDLQSNDRHQTRLQGQFEDFSPPWFYERKRGEWEARGGKARLKKRYGDRRVENDFAAQAYYACFHDAAAARARKRFLFTSKREGGLYEDIFNTDTRPEPLLFAYRAGRYVKKKADAYRREIKGIRRGVGPAEAQKKLDREWFKFGEQFALGVIGWHLLRHTELNSSTVSRLATKDFDAYIEAAFSVASRDLTIYFRRLLANLPIDPEGERERIDYANYVKGNWSDVIRTLETEWTVVRTDEPDPLAPFFS